MNQLDALTRFDTVRLATGAANEDDHASGAAAAVAPTPLPAGWDPFEVWRTRVRDARRDADGSGGR